MSLFITFPNAFHIHPKLAGRNRGCGVRTPFGTLEAARTAAQKLASKKQVSYEIRQNPNDGTGRLVFVEEVKPA